MLKKIIFISTVIFATSKALATDVSHDINFVSPQRVMLTDKEAWGIKLANQWKNNPKRPIYSG
ncbi:P-type conjugative transfer protein TrbG, partial [Candidatus Bartonella raoultii]|nr:P-type conjugative transfer protein TrbG [Bartonella raoultii]